MNRLPLLQAANQVRANGSYSQAVFTCFIKSGFNSLLSELVKLHVLELRAPRRLLTQLRVQMSHLQGQVAAIADERLDTAGVDKTMAGAIVYLDGGSIKVCKPMIRAGDLKKLHQS